MRHLESMESRRLFSFTYTTVGASDSRVTATDGTAVVTEGSYAQHVPLKLSKTGTLFVRGTSDGDRISVRQNSEGNILVFTNNVLQDSRTLVMNEDGGWGFGDSVTSFSSKEVKRINVSGGGGRDLVTVQVSNKIKASLADSTGKDSLTRYALDAVLTPAKVRRKEEAAAQDVMQIFWGQGEREVDSAPAGVTPLKSINDLMQSLTFKATADLAARFVRQSDGTYRAYGYDYDHKLIELTLYDYTTTLSNPESLPIRTADGQ